MSQKRIDPQLMAEYAINLSGIADNVAYILLDHDLRIIQFLPEDRKHMPADLELTINQKITESIYELDGMQELIASLLNQSHQVITLENINRVRADGSAAYLTVHLALANQDRPADGLLLLIKDISELGHLQQTLIQEHNELRLLKRELTQKNEELQTLNQMKSLFFSMAAHDLRSPLTAIKGYADLLLRLNPTLGERSKGFIHTIHSQTGRLNRLIEDFLELDLIEQDRIQLLYKEVDFSKLIHEVMRLFEVHVQKNKQQLTIEIYEALTLNADYSKVERIIYNLLHNAIKYTPEEGRIHVRAFETEHDIVCEIIDDGVGMSADEVAGLFTLYYRTGRSIASDISGSGVGLYIVKTFVDAHGGEILVSSQLEQGTTFKVCLPKTKPSNIEET